MQACLYLHCLQSLEKDAVSSQQFEYGGTKWWNRDFVVDIEVHVFFFVIKAFGRNIELRVKLSYEFEYSTSG